MQPTPPPTITLIQHEEVLLWSYLFTVLNTSSVWILIFLPRLGTFSAIISIGFKYLRF